MRKTRENEDLVQDAIEESGFEGISLAAIAKKTGLSYGVVQKTAYELRRKARIAWETRSRVIHLFPKI